MQNIRDTIRQELAALETCVHTLRQLDGNRAKGRYLCEDLVNRPALAKYWRAAASRAPLTPAMVDRLKAPDFPSLRGLVIDHSLLHFAGVTPALLVKVFDKLGLKPIESLIAPPAGLVVRFTSSGHVPVGHATVIFEYNGERFGNGTFFINHVGQAGMAALRAVGIAFDVPNYVSPFA